MIRAADPLWDGWDLDEVGKGVGCVAELTGNAEVRGTMSAISLIAPDVTAAKLVERTMAKKSFGNLTRLLFKP